MIHFKFILLGVTLSLMVLSCKNGPLNKTQPSQSKYAVTIKKENGVYRLYKNGLPFFVKGAAGYDHISELAASGANTLTIWNIDKFDSTLNEAAKDNISVILGIDLPGWDFEEVYTDQKLMDELYIKITKIVARYKSHPAVLAWCLGNELIMPINPHSSIYYKNYNKILKMIHTDDPNHPVTTAIINFQKQSILNIQWKIRDLDFISINTYNKLKEIKEELTKVSLLWRGPYMISEWSPNGGWESETTVWEAPIENTSTKKAEQFNIFYKNYMPVNDPRFLGSIAFYWGNRQEYTHTWYSIFDEAGIPTEIKEVLSDCWKDTVTKHESVKLEYMMIDGFGARNNNLVSPGSKHLATLLFPAGQSTDSLKYNWEILKEDWSYWGRTWNNFKRQTPEMGLLSDSNKQNTNFIAPLKEGPYRIFITVYNTKGYCATANTPFYVVQ